MHVAAIMRLSGAPLIARLVELCLGGGSFSCKARTSGGRSVNQGLKLWMVDGVCIITLNFLASSGISTFRIVQSV